MRVVPSSPRARRRLLRLGIALLAAGAITTVAVLVRGPKGPDSSPAKNAPPAQLLKQSTYVSPADRRAIDQTLDQFIPAGLDGRSPATAWRLSGPELKGGSTLREWRHGTSPIPYYPARGKTFHHWTVIDSGPDYVDFNIIIHPRNGRDGSSEAFSGKMLKREGRWVVDGLYTIAVFARPDKKGRHEVGPADYAAGAAASSGSAPPSGTGKSTLGKGWLAVIGGGILLALLFPVGVGVASATRSRRSRRSYARSRGQALPPLPRKQPTPGAAGRAGIGRPRH